MIGRPFGGDWTNEKLRILEKYLVEYTKALKRQQFRLVYVDAFAGEGTYRADPQFSSDDYSDFQELRNSSPRIALGIQDKPFDELIFIEKDATRCESLEALGNEFPDRNTTVLNEDANDALPRLCKSLGDFDRAVVFLDPYATQVDWSTVLGLARTRKIDCWILFPLMAINRMMPRNKVPPVALARQLDRIFGGREHWQDFYKVSLQQQLDMLSEEPRQERLQGSDQIVIRYRERLESEFEKVAPTRRTLKNSTNSPLFELLFAASNPVGADLAVRIADYILEKW